MRESSNRAFVLRAALLVGALRLVHGAGLFSWLHQSRGYVTTSLDEFHHLGRAWRLSLGPLFALPDMAWQPPAQTFMLSAAMRLWPDPYPVAALASIVVSAVPVIALAGLTWRLSGSRRAAFFVAAGLASCAGALNLVGLVPALPHGVLAASFALAAWAAVEAVSRTSWRSVAVATLCLAVVPLTRWEGIALIFPLSAILFVRALAHARETGSKAWLITLAIPIPFLLMLWVTGLDPIAGRNELLVNDTPPHEAALMAKIGPLASLYYLGYVSPVVLLAALAGVALAMRRWVQNERQRWPLAVAFASLGAVLAFYGYLFTRQAAGAAPERLGGVIAVAFLPFAALALWEGGRALLRWLPWRPVSIGLLVLLAFGAAAAEQGRMARSLRARYTESFVVAEVAKRCGLGVQVEQDRSTYFGMVPGMVSVLMGQEGTPALLPEDRDLFGAVREALAMGDAALLISEGAVQEVLDADLPGTRLVLAQDRRLGPVRWVLALPGDDACLGDAARWVAR